jgi:5-methylcytosine-specific restriction endonuclease McrA
MRKQSVKSVKTRAWKAISKYVRQRDRYCVTCGAIGNQAGHYRHNTDKPTQNLGGNALWYDIRNINSQCSSCNLYKSGNLTNYALYLVERYGHGILQEIQRLYNTPKKWTMQEVIKIAEHYEQLVENDIISL